MLYLHKNVVYGVLFFIKARANAVNLAWFLLKWGFVTLLKHFLNAFGKRAEEKQRLFLLAVFKHSCTE